MNTPKDALYKLRQREFRKLNKRKLKPDQVVGLDLKVPEVIEHKNQYNGKRQS